MNPSAVGVILAHSFKESVRGRWFLLFTTMYFFLVINLPALALAALSILPPYFMQQYLSTYVVIAYTYIPLITLPMGATAVVEEREMGTLQYVMSNPISKVDFLLGRVLGMLLATTLVVLLGFGIAAGFVYGLDFSQYPPLAVAMVAAVFLNGIMLALALTVSIVSNRRGTAVGIAIFLWFLFSVLSDIATLGVLSSSNGQGNSYVALPGLILDPVFASQSWAIFALGKRIVQSQNLSLVNTSGVFHQETGIALMVIMLVWLAVCYLIAFALFKRRDVV